MTDLPETPEDSPDSLYDGPSNSQVKREMLALVDLGKELCELSPERLKQLPLSERLYDSIRLAQRTTSREGLRRQVHFVGKLMRDAQADLIRAQLETWKNGSREQTQAMHRLLKEDGAFTVLLQKYPHADIHQLRTFIREGRKEMAANENLRQGQDPLRKHYRALFQALKTLQETAQDPSNESSQDPNVSL